MIIVAEARALNWGVCAVCLFVKILDAQIFSELEQPWWNIALAFNSFNETSDSFSTQTNRFSQSKVSQSTSSHNSLLSLSPTPSSHLTQHQTFSTHESAQNSISPKFNAIIGDNSRTGSHKHRHSSSTDISAKVAHTPTPSSNVNNLLGSTAKSRLNRQRTRDSTLSQRSSHPTKYTPLPDYKFDFGGFGDGSDDPQFEPARQKYLDNYRGLKKVLHDSVVTARSECRRLSRNLLWTCPLAEDPDLGCNVYKMKYKKNTKEFGYVTTLNSASLTFTIREACISGELEFCDCPEKSETRLNETHTMINDCYDSSKNPKDLARKFTDKPLLPAPRQFYLDTAVVLHNYLLGRKLVEKMEERVCRCAGTGVSGSCTQHVCWNNVDFTKVTHSIRQRYINAIRVKLGNEFSSKTELPNLVPVNDPFKSAKKTQMVYSSLDSEAECLLPGQECRSQSTGHLECEQDCCSGNFTVREATVSAECNCVFTWCCEVKCETCNKTVEQPVCS